MAAFEHLPCVNNWKVRDAAVTHTPELSLSWRREEMCNGADCAHHMNAAQVVRIRDEESGHYTCAGHPFGFMCSPHLKALCRETPETRVVTLV